jgi:hypothetical protein
MEQIALAIGKDDSGAFATGHFGDSDRFAKYVLHADGELEPQGELRNDFKSEDERHGKSGKLKSVLEQLGGIHCVISRRLSPNFKAMALQSAVQPVVVEFDDDARLLRILSGQRTYLFGLVSDRLRGERRGDVPVLAAEKEPPEA